MISNKAASYKISVMFSPPSPLKGGFDDFLKPPLGGWGSFNTELHRGNPD